MPQSGLLPFGQQDEIPGRAIFGLRTGRVIGAHWEDHTVDILATDNSTYMHVPIISGWAGLDYGEWSRPQLAEETTDGLTAGEAFSIAPTGKRDSYALFAFVEGFGVMPIVLGFFYPEVSQMMFSGLQRLTRHVGDTFTAIGSDGVNYLAFNKDGSAISFNVGDPRPPIVTLTDYDQRSEPEGRPHNITLYLANGSKVELDGATGDILIQSESGARIDILSSGDMSVSADGALDLSGNPLTLSGLSGFMLI